MSLLPIRRPALGLAFSSRSATLVELAGRGGAWRWAKVRRLSERQIPAGLLQPSEAATNVTDRPALARELAELVKPFRGHPVAVSLPDQAAHFALYELESLPKQQAECEALLRWRLREDLNLPRGELQLAYRTFRQRGAAEPSGTRALALTVALRRDVAAQYEALCEDLGLLPVSIGLSSLDVFDLCRGLMAKAREIFFGHHSVDGLTFLALQQGVPAFVRMKSRRGAGLRLQDELLSTLQFYHDHTPSAGGQAARADPTLWLVDSVGGASDIEEVGEPREEPPCRLTLAEGLHVGGRRFSIRAVGWNDLARLRSAPEQAPRSGLPALAAVLAA